MCAIIVVAGNEPRGLRCRSWCPLCCLPWTKVKKLSLYLYVYEKCLSTSDVIKLFSSQNQNQAYHTYNQAFPSPLSSFFCLKNILRLRLKVQFGSKTLNFELEHIPTYHMCVFFTEIWWRLSQENKDGKITITVFGISCFNEFSALKMWLLTWVLWASHVLWSYKLVTLIPTLYLFYVVQVTKAVTSNFG